MPSSPDAPISDERLAYLEAYYKDFDVPLWIDPADFRAVALRLRQAEERCKRLQADIDVMLKSGAFDAD